MANLIGLSDFDTKSSKDYKRGMAAVEAHMQNVLEDDTLHAFIVGGGKTNYRNTFAREFRAVKALDSEMSEMLWNLFVGQWHRKFDHRSPKHYLDALEIQRPPTQDEIDNGWVHESASSDAARRHFGVA